MELASKVEMLSKVIPKENIYINEPMNKHTTFRIGGNADVFITIENIQQLNAVLEICKDVNLTIIGNGSNILVRDKGIRGMVLKINMQDYKIDDDVYAYVESGMLNVKLAQILMRQEITGFEFASGIPGTIGGAIKMNAGAYGKQISDIIENTTYIDLKDYKIKKINKLEHKFSYRHSVFADENAIILSTILKLEHGEKADIQERMKENLLSRKLKQPIENPSAGSTFKRGNDFITAQLIDKCGLRGYTIGGAQVSLKHAGFIVNTGNASAEDVLKLTQIVKKKVYEEFNKNIELEIEVIGEE